jgi:hypothetical protein
MRNLSLTPWLVISFLGLSSNADASSCGTWERIERASQFATEKVGTLALVQDSKFIVLGRGTCVNLRQPVDLYFNINHNNASTEQPTFVSIHVALIKVGARLADSEFLYRNGSYWKKDRSGLKYSSIHQTPHNVFEQQLNGQQADFDKTYVDEAGRTWNDGVQTNTTPPLLFETWPSRRNFSVRQEVRSAIDAGSISAVAQNYLVSFVPRVANPDVPPTLGSPPDFSVSATGYDCVFVRITGTSAFPEMAGEYMINFRSNATCDSLLTGFSGRSLWSLLGG